MSDLIWLHEDCLRATHPLFNIANTQAEACFIWDDAYFAAMHYGLKRRVFIYETLLELPVDIVPARLVDGLLAVARQSGATRIVTGKTANPLLRAACDELRGEIPVTAIADRPFVQIDAQPELKRFFKYWNKAKKNAFKIDGRAG